MFNKVIAIIRSSDLEQVEKRLEEVRVRGITVTKAKGCGEYRNFLSPDWKVAYARIEIFTTRPEEVAAAIVDAAHSGCAGDGIVAIVPVKKLYRIRDRREMNAGEE